ncbi:heme-binding protein [Rhodococcus sp. APC 3903]|uniref:GlcG/HbpS family heme-binding protein n=1 Tax=Rhodococcus sp. APC 3903 TaxID=3035193 RepID=UPI0025B446E1|nr:heme-binding protein [Rhodococcus sp. APC 3903]MDN3460968.1 heme-binding protein [Rhodococcus sp. APC 3903]
MPENVSISTLQQTITLDHANDLIQRGRAAARDAGIRAVFAVFDPGANLVAFGRSDGAWLASNDLAIAKARTSVMFQMPSGDLSAPLVVGEPVAHFDHISGLLLMGGGLPILDADGVLIGALGVSGGTPDEDAQLAAAALATSSDQPA